MELKLKDALVVFNYHCVYEKNLTDKTLKAYSIDLDQFREYNGFNEILVQDFTKHHIKEYIKVLYDKGLKVKSIKRKAGTLKTFFSFLEFEDLITVSPFKKMKLSIKLPQTLPKTIDMKELKRLFKYLYTYKDSVEDKSSYEYKYIVRDIAVIELLFATGMRVSELCNLKPSNINITQGTVHIFGKGRKERVIQICNPDVKKSLHEYFRLYKNKIVEINCFFISKFGTKFSEDSVRYMVTKFRKLSGIKTKITPHQFRHTLATGLLEESVDIRYIQMILGHSSILTTQIYTKVNSKQQKKILATKHPRKHIYT